MTTVLLRVRHVVLVSAALLACLPDESRSRPGSVEVTVASPLDIAPSWQTTDGWHLTVRRLYAHVGGVELSGDDCEPYSETGYSRLLDLLRPESQKVSSSYGLGTCSVAFAISEPRWNTVVGEGIRPEWVALFRTAGSDGETDGGVTSFVEGNAERRGVVVRFAWAFRARLAFSDCEMLDGGGVAERLRLRSAGIESLHLEADPLSLFREPSAGEMLRFDDLAAADASSEEPDGDLTLEELRGLPASIPPSTTLFEELYYQRLPGLIRVVGGRCQSRVARCDGSCDD